MTNSRYPIDLGTMQSALANARRTHALNSKALTKAQDAAARSKKILDDAHAALDAASRNVLANG
jgi:hypothetical protein